MLPPGSEGTARKAEMGGLDDLASMDAFFDARHAGEWGTRSRGRQLRRLEQPGREQLAHTDTDAHADPHAHPDSHSNAGADSDTDAHADADSFADARHDDHHHQRNERQ